MARCVRVEKADVVLECAKDNGGQSFTYTGYPAQLGKHNELAGVREA